MHAEKNESIAVSRDASNLAKLKSAAQTEGDEDSPRLSFKMNKRDCSCSLSINRSALKISKIKKTIEFGF